MYVHGLSDDVHVVGNLVWLWRTLACTTPATVGTLGRRYCRDIQDDDSVRVSLECGLDCETCNYYHRWSLMWSCGCNLECSYDHDLGRLDDEYAVVGLGVDRHDAHGDCDAR